MAALVVLAQFPVLLNQGLFADDWLNFVLKLGYSIDLQYFLNAGHPFEFALFTVANATGMPIASIQIVTLAAVLLGALALVSTAARLDALTHTEAVVCAVLIFAWPGYELWAGKGTASYVVCLGLFFVAARVWLFALDGGRGARAARIIALLAFFVSFSLHSVMVLYALSLPMLLMLRPVSGSEKRSFLKRSVATARALLLRYPDFVVLPLVYWVMLGAWFPRQGPYADYYHIRLSDPGVLLEGLNAFIRWGLIERVYQAWTLCTTDRLLLAAAAFGSVGALLMVWPRAGRPSARSIAFPAVAALLSFMALAIPYFLVMTLPSAHFYESRHLLLFGIPAALLYLCVQRLANRLPARWPGGAIAAITLALTIASTWQAHFFLQARWLQQLAMVHDLKRDWQKPPPPWYSIW